MERVQTQAIVFRKFPLLEKDVMYRMFSADLGKISAVAKNVKIFTSRRASHLQTGNIVTLELRRKGDYFYISQSVVVTAFSAIKTDPSKIDLLYKMLFVLDRILPDQEPEPALYRFVIQKLTDIARAKQPAPGAFTDFVGDTLQMLGYAERNQLQAERMLEEIIHEKIPDHVII